MAIDPNPLVWANDAMGGTATSAANFNRITAEVQSEIRDHIAAQAAVDSSTYAPIGAAGATDATVAPLITEPLTKAALDGAYATSAALAGKLSATVAATAPASPAVGAVWVDTSAPVGSGCRVVKAAADQAIQVSTHTAVVFDVEEFDDAAFHSTSTNTSRLTVPATGRYRVTAQATWLANASAGSRLTTLWKNGVGTGTRLAQVISEASSSALAVAQQLSTGPISLVAGDYVEMSVYQATSAATWILATSASTTGCWATIERVS